MTLKFVRDTVKISIRVNIFYNEVTKFRIFFDNFSTNYLDELFEEIGLRWFYLKVLFK